MTEINKIKIDNIDKKILSNLELNSRIAFTELAKKVKTSRTIVEYRIGQMEKNGIINGYYSLLDPSKFGYTVWKLWISLRTGSKIEKQRFFNQMEKDDRVWWYAECTGVYDIVICVLAKTPHDFNNFLNSLQQEYGEIITDSAILINVNFEYHTRGFLLNQPSKLIESSFQEKPLDENIGTSDIEILKLLSENARINYAEMSEKTGKNVKTIKKIIDKLKKSGIIVYFRTSIDTGKIGYEFYKVLLNLHNPKGGILPSIIHWCRSQKNVTAVISCVGPWQLELEVETDSYRNLCSTLGELRDKFPEVIKSYETLLITREGKSDLNLADKIKKTKS